MTPMCGFVSHPEAPWPILQGREGELVGFSATLEPSAIYLTAILSMRFGPAVEVEYCLN